MAAAERIVATILGCGSSAGVPRIGNNWGVCDPGEPRNRRRRCSLLLEGFSTGSAEPTRVLIDTGPDLREQLLDANVDRLDAVFYTHEHADHVHGIDDLRVLALNSGRRVPVYLGQRAGDHLEQVFSYCFRAKPGSGYPPILDARPLEPKQPVVIDGPGGSIELLPVLQLHGNITSLGFRIGDFLYSCDLSGFPPESAAALKGLGIWVIDALRPAPHPSHLSLSESLALIERHAPALAVLTNLHIDMDYRTVAATTPTNVHPAFDGMQLDLTAGVLLDG